MPKGREKGMTVFTRAEQFKREGMYVFDKKNKIMMCEYCNSRVAWERKSVVDLHCKSTAHQAKRNDKDKNSSTANKRQASINDSFEHAKKIKVDKETFIKSTVHAFVKPNIPLHKLDNPALRKWLADFVPGGGDLPKSQWLRDHYLPQIKADYDQDLKKMLRGRKIVAMTDETTNRKGEAALVILFMVLPDDKNPDPLLVVAAVKVLTECTGDQTSKALLQTFVEYDVAHKLDKIAKVFSDKLSRLNECVAKTKKLFKNTRKRKHRYLKFLRDKYGFTKAKEAKLFPLPIMTRWGSWRKSVEYLSVYLEDIVGYAKKIPQSESINAVKYFEKLSSEDIKIIIAEALFTVEYCTPVTELLLSLEASKKPQSHLLYSSLSEIKKVFHTLSSASYVKSYLSAKVKSSLNDLSGTKMKSLEDRMKSVSKKCDGIFCEYMSGDTGNPFFKASQQVFNPSKLVMGVSKEKLLGAKNKIPMLVPIPDDQFLVLHGLLSDYVKEAMAHKSQLKDDPVYTALLGMKLNHPLFVEYCLQVLYIPVTNVDCERAFSAYSDILSSRRTRMTTSNTEVMMCLYFGDGDDVNNNDNFNVVSDLYDLDPDDPDVM